MQAVVLVGGRGTRLDGGPDAPPKPLVDLCGVSVLDHVIGRLAPEGVDDLVLCTGYRADLVERTLGDGARYGVRIRYSVETTPRGTAGAVHAAAGLLAERFLVVYGDVVVDLDVAAMVQAHAQSGALATLAVHPNNHPFDSDRVVTDARGFVQRIVRKDDRAGPEAGALCNAALYVLEKRALAHVPDDGAPRDFARDVFPALLAAGGRLFAYRTAEYLADMGTAARRAAVETDLRAGVPARMRRSALRPAVLLDRDGVLVEDRPLISRAEDLRVLPGVPAALRKLNAARVLAACCTNQPVVARGEVTEEELHGLHRHLEGLLGHDGAWLDGVFACPHHPDGGFPGERPELKIPCACRKPQPGLIHQAVSALGIDRRASVFVGDRTADLRAARAAGVLPVGVLTGTACRDGRCPLAPEVPLVADLGAAVDFFLGPAPAFAAALRAGVGPHAADNIVALGGPSRAGKTLAANVVRRALHARGVDTLHLSLDRFIQPASERRPGAGVRERTRFDLAAAAVRRLVDGDAVLVPGYDPRTRGRAPSETFQWDRRGVLVLDGVLANALDLPGAMDVTLVADPVARARRHRAFYDWKGLTGFELEDAVRDRDEEDSAVAEASRGALPVTFDPALRLVERVPAP